MSRRALQPVLVPLIHRSDALPLQPPPWVMAKFASTCFEAQTAADLLVRAAGGGDGSLVSVCVENAGDLTGDTFRRATIDAYTALLDRVELMHARHPVRFWNFLPSIHRNMGAGGDCYMVFNEGRFAAFDTRYRGRGGFDQNVATASAVGHASHDLVIHCLASERPGRHLGNPRQVPPHHYSARYGPLPPCFARATVAAIRSDEALLLVGGTASIRGEESQHIGDLPRQVDETLQNLSSLIQSAAGDAAPPLSRFRQLRVYHPRPADANWLTRRLRSEFPNVARLELLRADLCRSELLVEIEGVAQIAPVAST